MLTINEEWQKFADKVIPKKAPNSQHRAMQIAFYAGVRTMLLINIAIGDESGHEETAIAQLEQIYAEVESFGKQPNNKH